MVYLRNSLIVTVAVVAVSVVVSFLACAALTLYRFRGRRFIMVLVMAVQMVPGAAMMIPQFVVFNRFGMLNTYVGLILAYMAMILPFSIWNLRGFFLGMPREVFESARVEGANEWQLMWRITFPLATAAYHAVAINHHVTYLACGKQRAHHHLIVEDHSRADALRDLNEHHILAANSILIFTQRRGIRIVIYAHADAYSLFQSSSDRHILPTKV